MVKFIMPIYLIAGVSLFSTAYAARILGIFMTQGRSRFVYNHAIMKSLHAAGHHITLITPFHSEYEVENFTYINPLFDDVFDRNTFAFDVTTITLSNLMNVLITMEAKQCHDVMMLAEIKEALTSSEKVYDVIFTEIISMHECYQILAARLQIPIIGTAIIHRWKPADNSLGIPTDLTVPFLYGFKATGRELNFFQRVQNVWSCMVMDYHNKIGTRRTTEIERFRQQYFSEQPSSASAHAKDISLVFYNSHPAFAPRPITPNAVEIGGIHLQPANALQRDLQTFIDEASHGVILFSFGSVVNASKVMTFEQRQAFITAFASIPQRVIWKFEEPIADLPQNIKLSNWIPQRDILEHKNVIAFISHCGQGGSYEAVVTSTPVIAVPLFGDQPANALQLVRLGVAVNLELETVTKKVILGALNAIINDTNYYKRMQTLSRAFKDRPMTPQELVVYWTEYVIRHNGAPHLRVLGADMPWYKYFMLDILALALLITSAVFLVINAIIRKMYGLIARKTEDRVMKKKFD